MIDDPTNPGTLIRSAPVLVNTPVWNYAPRRVANNVQIPAQVVPVIEAPEVEIPLIKEFGKASWVKVIKTTTHNAAPIALEELIGGDKDGDGAPDWANNEPPEVETEWYLLQTSKGRNGGKQELQGAVEELPNDDETVTRRYEFYKYGSSAWTIDGEQGEAMCDEVAADGLHGTQVSVGVTNANGGSHNADCTAEIIVGEYMGSNMVGFDAVPDLGLIDAIENGELNAAYVDRTLVHGGDTPYSINIPVGVLPGGLTVDAVTGILSGTPTESGVFTFSVNAIDNVLENVSKVYTIYIADPEAPVINPVISTNAVPGGIEAGIYYTTLTAVAGALPYDWSASSLPNGLTLSQNGIISGTPVFGSAGITTSTVTVTDADGMTGTKLLTITIAPALVQPAAPAAVFSWIQVELDAEKGISIVGLMTTEGQEEEFEINSVDQDVVISTIAARHNATEQEVSDIITGLAPASDPVPAPAPDPAPGSDPAPAPVPAEVFSWIQVEVDDENGVSKVGLMTLDGQEEEFEINTIDQDIVISTIATSHNATEQEVRDLIVF